MNPKKTTSVNLTNLNLITGKNIIKNYSMNLLKLKETRGSDNLIV
jgi:hypothetical protein